MLNKWIAVTLILLGFSVLTHADTEFTDSKMACDHGGFGRCADLSQKTAYLEAVKYLKEKKGLEVSDKTYRLFCGMEKTGDREGSSYHLHFNEKQKPCFINIWVDCTTGKIPEGATNSLDVRCQ